MTVAIATLFITMFALPAGAQSTTYDLMVAGVEVTSDNCNDLSVIDGVSGTVKYDHSTKTLTLDNATIDVGNEQAISSKSNMTIKLIGNNKVIANATTISTNKPMTITGGGTLDVESTFDCAIYVASTDLTIENCTVNAKGVRYGIAGYNGNSGEDLIIRNATVTAEGNEVYSIGDFATLTLEGCAITQPAGAAFDASLHGVALDGEIVKTKVVIGPTGTGIDTPTANVPAKKQGTYNLAGQRVGDSYKGIVIENGRKVVKK